MRTAKTPYAVLGVLTLGELSGYEIKATLDESVGHFWHESFGQLYPTLRRLEEDGLVTSRAAPGSGGPRRRIHALTPAGWEALRAWLAEPADVSDLRRDETLLKVFFGRHVGASVTAGHVRRRRELLAGLRRTYEQIERGLADEPSPDSPYWLMTVRHGFHLTTALLTWCDETLARLEDLEEA